MSHLRETETIMAEYSSLPLTVARYYRYVNVVNVNSVNTELGLERTKSERAKAGMAGDSALGSAVRILAAGMRILEEEGYEALSMRKVGAAVGLSQAAIYRHYKDKAELVSRIIETGYGDLVALSAIPEEGRAGLADLPVADILAEGIRRYFRFAQERPQLFKAVLLEDIGPAGREVAVLSAGVSGRRATFANLVELLRRGMATGEFRKADPEITAQALWASMFGLAARLVIESTRPEGASRAGEVIDRQIDLLVAGLRAR